jgi:hypothetical protein
MERREDRELLRRSGFAENEVMRLSKLRARYAEQERLVALEGRRRMEFVRWLVNTGKLTEQTA